MHRIFTDESKNEDFLKILQNSDHTDICKEWNKDTYKYYKDQYATSEKYIMDNNIPNHRLVLNRLKKFFIIRTFIKNNYGLLNSKVKKYLNTSYRLISKNESEIIVKIILHNMYFYDKCDANNILIPNNVDEYENTLLVLYKFNK